jgi:hypothetical protein
VFCLILHKLITFFDKKDRNKPDKMLNGKQQTWLNILLNSVNPSRVPIKGAPSTSTQTLQNMQEMLFAE